VIRFSIFDGLPKAGSIKKTKTLNIHKRTRHLSVSPHIICFTIDFRIINSARGILGRPPRFAVHFYHMGNEIAISIAHYSSIILTPIHQGAIVQWLSNRRSPSISTQRLLIWTPRCNNYSRRNNRCRYAAKHSDSKWGEYIRQSGKRKTDPTI
jgi:hypothetical protein